jgi:hypothetical protein
MYYLLSGILVVFVILLHLQPNNYDKILVDGIFLCLQSSIFVLLILAFSRRYQANNMAVHYKIQILLGVEYVQILHEYYHCLQQIFSFWRLLIDVDQH